MLCQGVSEKMNKQLETQLAELAAKLELSNREVIELGSQKSKALADNVELARQLEDAESQINQLNRAKQTFSKQLEEAKIALEEESRMRSKLNGDNHSLQVCIR